jgi:toxin ParE1/3/4
MPGLRAWRLSRYPYLVLYVEREEDIEVWRVLHGEREIPAWLREGG